MLIALQSLMNDASETALWMHHKLGPWLSEGPARATSSCIYCGDMVVVSTNPGPETVEIYGPVVERDCTRRLLHEED